MNDLILDMQGLPNWMEKKPALSQASFPDDRHGLGRDLNSNTVWDISDLCLTPSGVKMTRSSPLINVMFSFFFSPPPSYHLSLQPGQAIK